MKVEKFDFRRLYAAWDDALIGKRCLISDSLDDIFDYVENGTDCCNEPETVEKHDEQYAAFRSVRDGNSYRYAYVLDEDFVEKPLAEVRWFREDVGVALDKCITDRAVTDDDIVAVINDVDWEALEGVMIEHGWVVIDTAVAEYLRGIEDAKN